MDLSDFDGEGVADIDRAKNFLMHERDSNVQNKKLKQLLHEWYSAVRNQKLEGSSIAMPVTLHLVILGEKLTEQANLEFQALQMSTSSISTIFSLYFG